MKVAGFNVKGMRRRTYHLGRVEQLNVDCLQTRNALKGIRIPVFGLKGRRPSPLDDEGTKVMSI